RGRSGSGATVGSRSGWTAAGRTAPPGTRRSGWRPPTRTVTGSSRRSSARGGWLSVDAEGGAHGRVRGRCTGHNPMGWAPPPPRSGERIGAAECLVNVPICRIGGAMSHLPVNHPLRPVYRVVSVLVAGWLLVFGAVSLGSTQGQPWFGQGDWSALGLTTNRAHAVFSLLV